MSTREALIRAAQEVAAQEGTSVAVATITERAGVGVGSFYNHFDDKEHLFREAVGRALGDFEDFLITQTQHLEDPAEVLCTRLRLYCRMAGSHPQIARIITNSAPRLLGRPEGYSETAAEDVRKAIAAGRFVCDDIPLRLATVAGGATRINAIRIVNPTAGDSIADDFAAVALEILGMSRSEARSIAHRPLGAVLAT